MTLSTILAALIALGALLAGRRLFWLFVGAVGFVVGFQLATAWLSASPEWVAVLAGVAVGLVAAVVAVLLQYWAAALAGFGAGSLVLTSLAGAVGFDSRTALWVAGIAGGILAVVLILALFDWGLIILSAAIGAAVLTNLFVDGRPLTLIVFAVLLAVGIVVQSMAYGPATIERRVVRRPPEG